MKAELRRALGLGDVPANALSNYNGRMRVSEGGDGWTVITGTNRHIGVFPNNPDTAVADDVTAMSIPTWGVYRAVEQALSLDAATAAVEVDLDLSEGGKLRKLAPIQRASAAALAEAYARLREFTQQLEKQELARYSVPQIASGNVVAALADREVRDVIRGMGEAEQSALLEKLLRDGGDESLLVAILRSPVRFGQLEKFAATGWHDLIDRKDPAGRERLSQMRAAADWASAVLNTIGAILMPSFTSGQHSREDIWLLAAREHDAASLFGFNAGEVAQFQRRFQLAS